MLANATHQPLAQHLRQVREQHETVLKHGLGRVPLPDALVRKYPNADREWSWQWVFPASSHYLDRRTVIQHRHGAQGRQDHDGLHARVEPWRAGGSQPLDRLRKPMAVENGRIRLTEPDSLTPWRQG